MKSYDFIVVGGGIAGLSFALRASRHGSVAVLTKKEAENTNTAGDDFEIEIDGQLQTINLLTGSNQSEEAASQKAVEKAKDIERRIAERKPKDSYQVAIKEHVNEVIDDSNIITVCRYGAKILNTTSHTILDLDDYPVHLFDCFKPVRKLNKKDRIVFKFEQSVQKFPELGTNFRIYETTKGIRVIGNKYINPDSDGYTALMRKLYVDWIYIELSKKQRCYRARLTPKPHRMKIQTIKVKSPVDCQDDAYLNWEQAYTRKSSQYSVVRLVKSLGRDFSNDKIVKMHDRICNLAAARTLA